MDQFFQAFHKREFAICKISRSASCQARRKLSHAVFIYLFDHVCSLSDQGGPTLDYKGMRVFSLDGSTFRLPNQKAFVQEFGYTSIKHMTSTKVLARFWILHDVLNRVTYNAILDAYKHGGNALTYKHLEETDLRVKLFISTKGENSQEKSGIDPLLQPFVSRKLPPWNVAFGMQHMRCSAGTCRFKTWRFLLGLAGRSWPFGRLACLLTLWLALLRRRRSRNGRRGSRLPCLDQSRSRPLCWP